MSKNYILCIQFYTYVFIGVVFNVKATFFRINIENYPNICVIDLHVFATDNDV